MRSLRLATFNLESLDDSDRSAAGESAFAERLRVLRPQLQRLEADVLCLQEVNGQREGGSKHGQRSLRALDRLLQGTPYAGFQCVASGHAEDGSPRDVHNLAILSRHPIRSWRQIRHELVAPLPAPAIEGLTGPGSAPLEWERPLLFASIELPGGELLHVINLHLRAPTASFIEGQKSGPWTWKSIPGWAAGYFLSAQKRAGQALEARLLVDRILAEEPAALVAVCGDLNAEENEVPLRLLLAAEADTGSGALSGGSLVALERSLPADLRFTVLHHGQPQMLDHILASRALFGAYKGIEAHNEALGDELVGYHGVERPPESFHAPLLARFAWPDA